MSVNNPATHTVSFCRDYLRNWEIWECWLVKEPNIVAFKSWAFDTWLSGRETGKVTKEGTKLLAWEQWAIYVVICPILSSRRSDRHGTKFNQSRNTIA